MTRFKIATLVVVAAALALVAAAPTQFHNLLSLTHLDTVVYSPPVAGDLIAGNSSGKWDRVPPNTSTTPMVLGMTGDGTNGASPQWTSTASFTDIASTIQPPIGSNAEEVLTSTLGGPAILTVPPQFADKRFFTVTFVASGYKIPGTSDSPTVRVYLGNSLMPASNVLLETFTKGVPTGAYGLLWGRFHFAWDSASHELIGYAELNGLRSSANPILTTAPDAASLQFVLSSQYTNLTVKQFSVEVR